MNEWTLAQVAAEIAPEWLYQRALQNMIYEQLRIGKCVAVGAMGFRTGVPNERALTNVSERALEVEPLCCLDQEESGGGATE